MKKWKKLSSKLLLRHPRIEVWEDSVQLPDGRTTAYLHFGRSNDAATIIAVREDKKILIQKEYSYPPDEWLFQFPGGTIAPDEKPEQGALREFSEEADLTGTLRCIGWYYMSNRRSPGKMYVYVANELTAKPGTRDLEEEFENYWLDENEVEAKIKSGEFKNFSLLAAWSLYKNI